MDVRSKLIVDTLAEISVPHNDFAAAAAASAMLRGIDPAKGSFLQEKEKNIRKNVTASDKEWSPQTVTKKKIYCISAPFFVAC